MAKLRRNLRSAGHGHTFAAAPRVARSFYGPIGHRGLPLSEPFDPTYELKLIQQ